MAVSRAMRRLLRIRTLEEEQCRIELESAQHELSRLEKALSSAGERASSGRALIAASAVDGELLGRLAGLEEAGSAARHASALRPRIVHAAQEAAALRQQFLDRRVERRQAETLVEEAAAREHLNADRRSQQAHDDWYGARRHRQQAGKESPHPSASPEPGAAEET
jgi:predicted  nucleic acid-binding Zn-ribbon protein